MNSNGHNLNEINQSGKSQQPLGLLGNSSLHCPLFLSKPQQQQQQQCQQMSLEQINISNQIQQQNKDEVKILQRPQLQKQDDFILDQNFYYEEMLQSQAAKQSSIMIEESGRQRNDHIFNDSNHYQYLQDMYQNNLLQSSTDQQLKLKLFEVTKKQKLLTSKEINMLESSRYRNSINNRTLDNQFSQNWQFPDLKYENEMPEINQLQEEVKTDIKQEERSSISSKPENYHIQKNDEEIKNLVNRISQLSMDHQFDDDLDLVSSRQSLVPLELPYAVQKFPLFYLIIIEICLENSNLVTKNINDYFELERNEEQQYYVLHLKKIRKLKPMNFSIKRQIFSSIRLSEINTSLRICQDSKKLDIIQVQYELNYLLIKIGPV